MNALLLMAVLTQSPPVPAPLEAVTPAAVLVDDDPMESRKSARIMATFAGALVGGASGLALMAGAASLRRPLLDNGPHLIASLAALPLLIGLGAYGGHHLAGGHGTLGKAGFGAAMSAILPAVLFLLGGDMRKSGPSAPNVPDVVALSYGLAALPGIFFTTWLLEYSHGNEANDVQFTFAPTKGGATVGLGGSF